LKPDNILIDANGHLKLTDFGLSEAGLINYQKSMKDAENEAPIMITAETLRNDKWKVEVTFDEINNPNLKRVLGTPDYLAPEVLKANEVMLTKALDWWALGVITYEFICGSTPFTDDCPDLIFENIKNMSIKWPEIGYEEGQISPEAHDFITMLLNPDPSKRLGAGDAEEVKSHPFLQGIDWKNLMNEQTPFKPNTSNALDTQYFADGKKNFNTEDFKIGKKKSNNTKEALELQQFPAQKVVWKEEANKYFSDFETMMVDTLVNINKTKAKEVLLDADGNGKNEKSTKENLMRSYSIVHATLSNDIFYEGDEENSPSKRAKKLLTSSITNF